VDLAIFGFGLFALKKERFHWAWAAVFILVSNWLEIWLGFDAFNPSFPFYHKSTDTGLILYFVLFSYSILKFGVYRDHVLKKPILIFILFICINAFIDILDGVFVKDIVLYCRGWIYLSVIFVHPQIYEEYIERMMRIILVVVVITTIIIVLENLTHNYIFGVPISIERGVKPSFYVMLFILLLFFKALTYRPIYKWSFIIILFGSIIINLKMTYLLTVLLTGFLYVLLKYRKNILGYLHYLIIPVVVLLIVLFTNERLTNRLENAFSASESLQSRKVESTFSYRLLHTIERFDYIKMDTKYLIRGIGFIHEESFRGVMSAIGNYDQRIGKRRQLETPDIAWSNFIVRFGLGGTLLFVGVYLLMVMKLYKFAVYSPISMVYCVFMIVCLCFSSLGNAVISYGYFYLLPLLILGGVNGSHERSV
jgi:hypothetical protein